MDSSYAISSSWSSRFLLAFLESMIDSLLPLGRFVPAFATVRFHKAKWCRFATSIFFLGSVRFLMIETEVPNLVWFGFFRLHFVLFQLGIFSVSLTHPKPWCLHFIPSDFSYYNCMLKLLSIVYGFEWYNVTSL